MNKNGSFSVVTFKKSGNPLINGVVDGLKWGETVLSYAFPDDMNDFSSDYRLAFYVPNIIEATDAMKNATMMILSSVSAYTNLRFVEGSEKNSLIRVMSASDMSVAGHSGGIDTASRWSKNDGEDDGDAWVVDYMSDPSPGNRAWYVLSHEIGHSLGLKHGHVNGAHFPDLPDDKDGYSYSIMSYDPSASHFYSGSSVDSPQTYMIADIAGLQYMYGANYSVNNSDTVYSWKPNDGNTYINGEVGISAHPYRSFVWATIWDGGGNDTYDFSEFTTDNYLSIKAGEFSSFTTKPFLFVDDGVWYYEGVNIGNALKYKKNPESLIENIIAGSGNDTIVGNNADNIFTGNDGSDVFVLSKKFGVDIITDFTNDVDKILLMDDVTSIIENAEYIDGNTILSSKDNELILQGFDIANLDITDFVQYS